MPAEYLLVKYLITIQIIYRYSIELHLYSSSHFWSYSIAEQARSIAQVLSSVSLLVASNDTSSFKMCNNRILYFIWNKCR